MDIFFKVVDMLLSFSFLFENNEKGDCVSAEMLNVSPPSRSTVQPSGDQHFF